MVEYEDFSIKIEPQREDVYPVIVLRSPAGEARSSFHLPFDPDDIGDILVDLGQTVRGSAQQPIREAAPGATRTRPQQIGDQLFNSLFSGPVRSLLDRSLGMLHGRKQGLRLKLHIDPEDASLARLASLPWELMYRKETREFLNLSSFTPILRYLDVQVPCIPLPLEPPLRILIAIASPLDHAQLDLERERSQIEETWARQQDVAVDFLQPATILALQERLAAEPYHALHYMGHGGFERLTGRGVLIFEDERGYGTAVDGSTLGVLLRDAPTLRLVFLNACETARVTRQVGLDPFAGVAAAMVMAGIPAVVAMQFPITDVAAVRFANRFYPLLADGQPVDYAVAQGRQAILAAESGTMEWATPVLFMRAPDGIIFEVSDAHQARRHLRKPPTLDEQELAQQLEELYIAGLGAFWLEEWDKAVRSFETIAAVRPDYQDVAAKLEEARRRQKCDGLYGQAQAARAAEDWGTVIAALDELVAERADFKDAAALLELARRQKQLADLYAQAQRLHGAAKWRAVVNVFVQIHALDPDYADPDGLLATAEQQVTEQERQAALNDLFGRAVRHMDGGHWAEARALLAQVQEAEPGYRGADRLLERAEAEIARQEAKRQRQEQIAALYERAVNQADAGQWAQALDRMDEIRALAPEFADPQGITARAQAEIECQRRLEALYAQARAAHDSQDWPAALAALQALVEEDADYRDAAVLLAGVERQQALAGLYTQAQRQHQAGAWQAVVDTFARIAALEPGYTDPDALLPAAERSLAEQRRRAELDDLYNRAAQAMEAGDWAQARPLLAQIREQEPGYREAAQMLARAEAGLEQAEAERQRQEQVATLYEQAQSLARARQWRPVLAKMDEIRTLDAGFTDPQGIAARARERVAREEAEAQRQNDLAALYAEAVRLLKAEQYQEALEKWGEVQVLDPRYPDRKKVQATARKNLDELARPRTRRHLTREALIAVGAIAVVAVVVTAVALSGAIRGRGRIAFVSDRDGDNEIYVMNADGSGQTNLTNDNANDWGPAWSPDGQRIAFTSDRDGDNEIYVMNADGSEQTRLTDHWDHVWGPSWSPDGQHIAFVSNRDEGFQIYVMNADGNGPSRLTTGSDDKGFPSWSPDGNRIVFVSGSSGSQEIWVVNTDGTDQSHLPYDTYDDWLPYWSPDGMHIVFASSRDGNPEIYVMNADGSEKANLTNNPASEWIASWSPDGRYLTFVSDRDGNQEIYIMDADGSNPVRLTNNPAEDWWPAWSP
jgi:hypothetical protein